MSALLMRRHEHALRNDGPLNGRILVCVHAEHFIHGPAERAMVDDDVLIIAASKGIVLARMPIA
ncbi:hypothetical protein D3C77_789220 [compost metagenome]